MKPKYNHLFDISFSIDTEKKDPYGVTNREAIEALESRIEALKDEMKPYLDKPVGEWAYCDDTAVIND